MRRRRPRRRLALWLPAMATALIAMPGGAAPSNAAMELTQTSVESYSTSAGAYPTLIIDMTFCDPSTLNCNAAQKASPLSELRVTLPAGMVPTSNHERCSRETFLHMLEASDCPWQSWIGQISVDVNSFAGTPTQVIGSLHSVAPSGNEPAVIGIFIDPLVNSPYELTRILAPVTVERGDTATFGASNLSSIVRYDNGSVFWPYYKVTKISLTMFGGDVWEYPLLRNPTSCGSGKFRIHASSSDLSSATKEIDYTTADCETLPFSPSLSVVAGEPGRTATNDTPPIGLNVAIPRGHAAAASATIKLPPNLRPSTAALAEHSCHPDTFATGGCPASTEIGSLSVSTPLLDSPLSGPIQLVKVPGELRMRVIARLRGQVSLDLEGNTGFEGNRSIVAFNDLPDVPVDDFSVSLDGGPDGVFLATSDLCSAGATAESILIGRNGTTRTLQSPVTVSGCGAASAQIVGGDVAVSSGYALVRVRCSDRGPGCSGKLSLVVQKTKRGKVKRGKVKRGKIKRGKVKRGKIKRYSLPVGSASFNVPAGRTKIVAVKITRKVARELTRKRKLAGSATAQVGGSQANATVKLKAEPSKRKKARRSKRR